MVDVGSDLDGTELLTAPLLPCDIVGAMLRSEFLRASLCLVVAREDPPVLPSHDPGGVVAPDLFSLLVADGVKEPGREATIVSGTTAGAGSDRGSDCCRACSRS